MARPRNDPNPSWQAISGARLLRFRFCCYMPCGGQLCTSSLLRTVFSGTLFLLPHCFKNLLSHSIADFSLFRLSSDPFNSFLFPSQRALSCGRPQLGSRICTATSAWCPAGNRQSPSNGCRFSLPITILVSRPSCLIACGSPLLYKVLLRPFKTIFD